MTPVLFTGGCGFIGTNLVLDRFRRGDHVRVIIKGHDPVPGLIRMTACRPSHAD